LTPQSIAVLPFKTDPDQVYLGHGIAHTLAVSLRNSKQLSVRPLRASVLYPSMNQSATDAGRALQVDAVLQGTAKRTGDQVTVNMSLVRTRDGAVLWQLENYSLPLLGIQDALANQVAQGMNLNLSDTGKRYTNNSEAYDRYLRARHQSNRRRPREAREAVEFFDGAIKLDPNYAEAYAGMAHAYILSGSQLMVIERMQRARAAAQKALALDEQLAEAHMALGRALIFCDWDWAGSEKAFKRAIELSPNYADAHFWYSHNLTALGRHDEALAELKQAFDIDPFFPRTVLRQGQALYLARQYDRAVEQYLRTPFEVDAAYFQVYWRLGLTYAQKEMYSEAINMLRKAQTFSEEISLGNASLAYVYAKSGKSDEARKILKELREAPKAEEPLMMMAGAYGYLGEKDKAIECLEKLYEIRDTPILHIKVEPLLDSIRSDPRYEDLVRRVGLTP
jgi:tetratricopeptide (TPR) repeat protein